MTDDKTRERVEAIFADLLDCSLDDGSAPDVEAACAEHPGLADELRAQAQRYAAALDALAELPPLLGAPAWDPGELAGQTIGAFEVLREIGRGGMGVVFLAKHAALERRVALKVLYPELAADPEWVARFSREAKAVAKLQHRNVLVVHSVGHDGQYHFIETELLEGETLAQRLARGPKLDAHEATRIMCEVVRGVAAAHNSRLVHRDIKPSNVILAEDGAIKVMDFGLAVDTAAEGSKTTARHIVGTPYYMSPEQGDGQPTDARSDIYALGSLYYELLTGVVPYDAVSARDILDLHKNAPVPDPRDLVPDLPSRPCVAAMKAMAKDPADRYQTCGELMEDLEQALGAQDGEERVSRPAVGQHAGQPSAWNDMHQDAGAGSGAPQRSSWAVGVGVAILALVCGWQAWLWLGHAALDETGPVGPLRGRGGPARLAEEVPPARGSAHRRSPTKPSPVGPRGAGQSSTSAAYAPVLAEPGLAAPPGALGLPNRLTEGVHEVGGMLACLLLSHRPEMRPIVSAGPAAFADGLDLATLPVAVAGPFGQGRVVALGHDGWLTNLASQHDNARFVANCLRWLSPAGRPKRIAFLTHYGALATTSTLSGSIRESLAGDGFVFLDLEGPSSRLSLQAQSVLVLTRPHTGAPTPKEIDAVTQFVGDGGGVLMAGLGWFWAKTSPQQSQDEFPLNAFGRELGVTFTAHGVYEKDEGRLRFCTRFEVQH